jgi:hypothetical protein
MPEAKLADRVAMYGRALQNSVKLRTISTDIASAQITASHPSTSSSAVAPMSDVPLDVNSALGKSYDDAHPPFGAGAEAREERTN